MDPLSFYMVPILTPFVAWAVVAGVVGIVVMVRAAGIEPAVRRA